MPILEDGPPVIRDSQAILVYLAAAYGGLAWWPAHALGQAEIVQWLAFAVNEIQRSLCRARLIRRFGEPVNAEAALQGSNTTLAVLDQRLSDKVWLAIGRPSIADCAVHPYVALGGIALEPHRNLARWIDGGEACPAIGPSREPCQRVQANGRPAPGRHR